MKIAFRSSFRSVSNAFCEEIEKRLEKGEEIYLPVDEGPDLGQNEWLEDLFPSPRVHILNCPYDLYGYLSRENIEKLLDLYQPKYS